MRMFDRLLFKWRAAVARPWVPTGANVLDVGCHQGEFLRGLGKTIGPSVGLDPYTTESTGHLTLRADRFPPADPLPSEAYDTVVMLATLEHIQDKDEVAASCARLLRPGGRVVITVPSPRVDAIIGVLQLLRLADGMSVDEHHGFDQARTPEVFTRHGFELEHYRRFQLGLNHLYVFRKSARGLRPLPIATSRSARDRNVR